MSLKLKIYWWLLSNFLQAQIENVSSGRNRLSHEENTFKDSSEFLFEEFKNDKENSLFRFELI